MRGFTVLEWRPMLKIQQCYKMQFHLGSNTNCGETYINNTFLCVWIYLIRKEYRFQNTDAKILDLFTPFLSSRLNFKFLFASNSWTLKTFTITAIPGDTKQKCYQSLECSQNKQSKIQNVLRWFSWIVQFRLSSARHDLSSGETSRTTTAGHSIRQPMCQTYEK